MKKFLLFCLFFLSLICADAKTDYNRVDSSDIFVYNDLHMWPSKSEVASLLHNAGDGAIIIFGGDFFSHQYPEDKFNPPSFNQWNATQRYTKKLRDYDPVFVSYFKDYYQSKNARKNQHIIFALGNHEFDRMTDSKGEDALLVNMKNVSPHSENIHILDFVKAQGGDPRYLKSVRLTGRSGVVYRFAALGAWEDLKPRDFWGKTKKNTIFARKPDSSLNDLYTHLNAVERLPECRLLITHQEETYDLKLSKRTRSDKSFRALIGGHTHWLLYKSSNGIDYICYSVKPNYIKSPAPAGYWEKKEKKDGSTKIVYLKHYFSKYLPIYKSEWHGEYVCGLSYEPATESIHTPWGKISKSNILPTAPSANTWDPLDDTPANATFIPLSDAIFSHGPHSLSTQTDTSDFFTFHLPENASAIFYSSSDSGSHLFATLLDSTLNEIAVYDANATHYPQQFSLIASATAADTYFLQVQSDEPSAVYTLHAAYNTFPPVLDEKDSADDSYTGTTEIVPTPNFTSIGNRTLSWNDRQDWFSFSATEGQLYTFTPSDSRCLMTLHTIPTDTTEALVSIDSFAYNPSRDRYEMIADSSTTYYLCLSITGFPEKMEYALSFSAPDRNVDPWDSDDDTEAGATRLPPATSTIQTHSLHSLAWNDPIDWFALPVTQNSVYRLTPVHTSGLRPHLIVTNAEDLGTLSSFFAGTSPSSETFLFTAKKDGLLYFNVTAPDVSDYFLNYQLNTRPPIEDPYPNDNDIQHASPISPSTALQKHGPHSIAWNDRHDLFKVELRAATTYTFAVDALGVAAQFYALLTADSPVYYFTRYATRNAPMSFSFTPQTSGTYLLLVFAETEDADYDLYYFEGTLSKPIIVNASKDDTSAVNIRYIGPAEGDYTLVRDATPLSLVPSDSGFIDSTTIPGVEHAYKVRRYPPPTPVDF